MHRFLLIEVPHRGKVRAEEFIDKKEVEDFLWRKLEEARGDLERLSRAEVMTDEAEDCAWPEAREFYLANPDYMGEVLYYRPCEGRIAEVCCVDDIDEEALLLSLVGDDLHNLMLLAAEEAERYLKRLREGVRVHMHAEIVAALEKFLYNED